MDIRTRTEMVKREIDELERLGVVPAHRAAAARLIAEEDPEVVDGSVSITAAADFAIELASIRGSGA